MTYRHCPNCRAERAFEQPPCADGHDARGGGCPEWACVTCGAALLIGELTAPVEHGRRRRSAAA
ncbi:MAG TPA: hypothetical protein VNE21_02700 [Mycobacteriales bacterium]|nr:hypothetical protein [Mycobacteriales bacterium]